MTTRSADWEIPRKVWQILFTWGLAVMVLATLFSVVTWRNQRQDIRQREQIQIEQDRAMCELTRFFTSSSAPIPAGPQGDRAREGLRWMNAYQAALGCDHLLSPKK